MKRWIVRFEVNGGEYSSALVIGAKQFVKQTGPRSVKADHVTIDVDEDIELVEPLDEEL